MPIFDCRFRRYAAAFAIDAADAFAADITPRYFFEPPCFRPRLRHYALPLRWLAYDAVYAVYFRVISSPRLSPASCHAIAAMI